MKRYEQIIQPKRVLQGEVEHDITVRKIGNGYNCRVFLNGVLNQEARCSDKNDISRTCRDLLRWEEKCGNLSKFASSARARISK